MSDLIGAGQKMQFRVSLPAAVHPEAITGRLFVILTRNQSTEPREQLFDVPIFSVDVSRLQPGATAIIDATSPGYPLASMKEIPAGDYYMQALLNVYTAFPRADGHTVWAHICLLYTSPSPRDGLLSRMPSSA